MRYLPMKATSVAEPPENRAPPFTTDVLNMAAHNRWYLMQNQRAAARWRGQMESAINSRRNSVNTDAGALFDKIRWASTPVSIAAFQKKVQQPGGSLDVLIIENKQAVMCPWSVYRNECREKKPTAIGYFLAFCQQQRFEPSELLTLPMTVRSSKLRLFSC